MVKQVNQTPPYWPSRLPKKLHYVLGEQPLYHYLRHRGEREENEPAYIFYNKVVTWGTLLDHVRRFARYLQEKGVRKGSYVALYMQNCPQYIIAHFAIQQLGGVVVPLNPMYRESELAYFFAEVPLVGIIAGEEGLSRIQQAEQQTAPLSFIVTCHYGDYADPAGGIPLCAELVQPKEAMSAADDFAAIIAAYPPLDETASIDLWNDVGLIIFTSGTTGRPKGAMLTYGNALFKTAASAQANRLTEKAEVLMAHSPLCHIAGMVMGLNTPVYTGHPCVLFTRFDPMATIKAIETYKVTAWYSIAPMNAAILQVLSTTSADLSSLKRNLATSFGLPVTKDLAERWAEATGGCLLYEAAYGLSETHTCDTLMPDDRVKFGSCGIPTYETDIRIIDPETKRELGPGQSGEIVVKNPGVFQGYFRRDDATSETLKDGWVYTGDIGYVDEDGYLYFQGRLKEMIKVSGYSVFPEDVEALLNEHPAVKQCAVIGVPDPMKGEVPKAFVVLHDSYKGRVAPSDLIEWAKTHMAAFKYPRYIEFIDELPATPSGKVLRKLLPRE
ncbi:AMP-binding protein [Geobacillus thermoleovorans]|uniref:AMP-binding protein n=1 Tax=Geobacillus thermoleovorans TaxID=33941 RepID=UPI003D22A1F5